MIMLHRQHLGYGLSAVFFGFLLYFVGIVN